MEENQRLTYLKKGRSALRTNFVSVPNSSRQGRGKSGVRLQVFSPALIASMKSSTG